MIYRFPPSRGSLPKIGRTLKTVSTRSFISLLSVREEMSIPPAASFFSPSLSRRFLSTPPSPDSNIAGMFRILEPSKLREISSDYPRPTKTHDELTSKKIQSSKQTVYLALGGNMIITFSKAAVWISTGSSAMLSEAIHSLVDSGNQALLLIGLRTAQTAPDSRFQYGYGKSVYFWSLVSALGTFWCGAGISMWNSVTALVNPSLELQSVGYETWFVLGIAFLVDGTVLYKTLSKVYETKPENINIINHIRNIRDPTTQAVLMEDAAACGGVLIALVGISTAQYTNLIVLDTLAGMAIAGILGAMGLYLARLNQKYLMGQSVGLEMTEGIKNILLAQESIDEVHSVQSQWVGPYSFSYKAEIDFDGTYIAAKLMNRYKSEFMNHNDLSEDEIKLLLAWYSEDVIREVEMEIRRLEEKIRYKYPEALYIELEPDGGKSGGHKDYMYYAIDDGRSEKSRLMDEIASLNEFEKRFADEKDLDRYRDTLEYNRGERGKHEGDF